MAPRTLLKEAGGRLRVLALTGIRSDYDLLYPLLKALREDGSFDLGVVACGAHLTPLHDYSIRNIEKDGFRIVGRIKNLVLSESRGERVKSCGRLLSGLGEVLAKEKPDLLIILGDREEPLMGAVAASYLSVPVVHLCGGDDTHPPGGNVDEEVRHAITKLSHVHLTMAAEHSRRVLRLGEEPWRVQTVGNPGLDRLRAEPVLSRAALAREIGPAALKEYLVVIHHSRSAAVASAAAEMKVVLSSSLATGLEVFVSAPNSDPGSESILKVMAAYRKNPRVHLYKNYPRSIFTALLRHARCLVGNSSLGLHEAPFIGLPCVNVGDRQKGRLKGANIEFVPATARPTLAAIRKAAFDEAYRARVKRGRSPYGDGRMVARALRILKHLPPKAALLAKRITF
jgi:GDP/UDP-N,N'-diacetylbacillosamine 2-epimerase (hydrolysing)